MNSLEFSFAGARLRAMGSGALWWPAHDLLCVSDLHLGKSSRVVRRGGPALPPYDNRETLSRLAADLDTTGAKTVVCLGDSFDDLEASESLSDADRLEISALQAGRLWIWIEGNHDPGPVALSGTHLAEWSQDVLVFRHIAETDAQGEVSGHFHPKVRLNARGRMISRPAFLFDGCRLIMPAYGTYTGGLRSSDTALSQLMQPDARAILTGPQPQLTAMPR
ncbi:ligase-associated DNA damage response endonuclease PdeM [Ruegeria arenilitoris]|uniref:ligase-associated DNA damage response endonuclease PdeM n=1 Tax=Ruegeria arenilitoris TaxID=1173585 RepID=UPI00147BD8CD|nr:ligase-associated DNA damage response endonuclease PdeM [Ruegeria arenilitoris]